MKILLIRLRLIGDVVFTTPAIRALRQRFPDAELVYLVERAAAPVLSENQHLTKLIIAERPRGFRRLIYDLQLAQRLRAARFDAVIDFHGGPRGNWLTWVTRAQTRIGYSMPYRRWPYTHLVRRPVQTEPRHSVMNQWDLLSSLDKSLAARPDPERDPVEMNGNIETALSVYKKLITAELIRKTIACRRLVRDKTKGFVVIHVRVGTPFRQWPIEFFIETIVNLAAFDPELRFVVTSDPSDPSTTNQIITEVHARTGRATPLVTSADHFGVAELQSLIIRAALFIGGDSGPLHIAATTTTPIVGIYGPTLATRSSPWRSPALITESVDVGELPCRPCDQRHCEPGDFRCLRTLPAIKVISAAKRALTKQLARTLAT
ncbi:MAG TPA: glycosyltransferase family 9 protein [Vicinamibacterales bacterium]|nr:glycosyltransferase family 9 protein [Vicinamibacterales bacterium]